MEFLPHDNVDTDEELVEVTKFTNFDVLDSGRVSATSTFASGPASPAKRRCSDLDYDHPDICDDAPVDDDPVQPVQPEDDDLDPAYIDLLSELNLKL